MSTVTVETATQALYQCGLKEETAAKIAEELALEGYENLPGPELLSTYLSPQSRKNLCFLQSRAELQEMLADLGFRPEVIPLATFADEILPHGVAESWVVRFARHIYAISE